MSTANPSKRLLELVAQLQLAEPTEASLAELEALLQDVQTRRLYIELTHLQNQLETLHTNRAAEDPDQPAEAEDILALLQEVEDAAPTVVVELPKAGRPVIQREAAMGDELTLQKTRSAAAYLLRHSVGAKSAAVLATAAAVVLGAVLLIVMLTGPEGAEPSVPIAEQQDRKDEPSPVVVPALDKAVATLTAERDAVWAVGVLAPGSSLQQNQTLTLTQGIAEITTNRGAVAILEAPASIELLDHDNALRLHKGKLLGICETPSSKGFVVRTPHMDITDLGTRFGVDATDPSMVKTHVIEGVISVARPGVEGFEVKTGGAAVAHADENEIKRAASEPAQFATLTPQRIALRSTGQGLSTGAIDPKWQVIAVDGKRLPRPEYLTVGQPVKDTDDDAAVSHWLDGTRILPDRKRVDTVFTCRSYFELPRGLNPETTSLVLHFAADESVRGIRINGEPFEVPANSWTEDQSSLHTLRIDRGLDIGTNKIELDVLDQVNSNSTRWNFHLRWHLEAGLAPPN